MKITLLQEDINGVSADGLVLPVDGQICVIGGTAAARALKASFAAEAEDEEEQFELYGYAEEDVLRLRPLAHGQCRIIEGNDRWPHLVVVAAFYHNVDGVVFSAGQACTLLTNAVHSVVRASAGRGIDTIAMTLMGTTYRVSARESIAAMSEGLAASRRENIEVKWCILRDQDYRYAAKRIDSINEL
jgi:hypothetical protein